MIFLQFVYWLRRPFPLLNDVRRIGRMAVVGFLFVTFFLYFFQPFGLHPNAENSKRWFGICLGYGLVTLVVLLLSGAFTRILPGIYQEEKWTVWKEILQSMWIVTLIAMANLIYTHFQYGAPLDWRRIGNWEIITLGVGIFPMMYGVFHKQYYLTKRYSAEASSLSQKIDHHEHTAATTIPSSRVILQGDNQGETLHLAADDVQYLAAADNYVQVFYLENGELKNRMLRTTLKKMEDALSDYPQFFRCHRTYLVNLNKVQQVSGNAQGYRLQLASQAETVPVSRNLNGIIQSRLAYN